MAFHVACPMTGFAICSCVFCSLPSRSKDVPCFLQEVADLAKLWATPQDLWASPTVDILVPRAISNYGKHQRRKGRWNAGYEEDEAHNGKARQKPATGDGVFVLSSPQSSSLVADGDTLALSTQTKGSLVKGKITAILRAQEAAIAAVETDQRLAICDVCHIGEDNSGPRALRMHRCKQCNRAFHTKCLKSWASDRDLFDWADWVCAACRTCEVCMEPGETSTTMFCKKCDQALHCYCLQPSVKAPVKGPFLCPNHTECHSCGTRVPGSGISSRWFLSNMLCDACGRLFVKNKYCPVCLRVYRDTEPAPMVCCDSCEHWVHCSCDNISDDLYQKYQSEEHLTYRCPPCLGKSHMVVDMADGARELWRRREAREAGERQAARIAQGLPPEEDILLKAPPPPDSEVEEEPLTSPKSEAKKQQKPVLKLKLKAYSEIQADDDVRKEKGDKGESSIRKESVGGSKIYKKLSVKKHSKEVHFEEACREKGRNGDDKRESPGIGGGNTREVFDRGSGDMGGLAITNERSYPSEGDGKEGFVTAQKTDNARTHIKVEKLQAGRGEASGERKEGSGMIDEDSSEVLEIRSEGAGLSLKPLKGKKIRHENGEQIEGIVAVQDTLPLKTHPEMTNKGAQETERENGVKKAESLGVWDDNTREDIEQGTQVNRPLERELDPNRKRRNRKGAVKSQRKVTSEKLIEDDGKKEEKRDNDTGRREGSGIFDVITRESSEVGSEGLGTSGKAPLKGALNYSREDNDVSGRVQKEQRIGKIILKSMIRPDSAVVKLVSKEQEGVEKVKQNDRAKQKNPSETDEGWSSGGDKGAKRRQGQQIGTVKDGKESVRVNGSEKKQGMTRKLADIEAATGAVQESKSVKMESFLFLRKEEDTHRDEESSEKLESIVPRIKGKRARKSAFAGTLEKGEADVVQRKTSDEISAEESQQLETKKGKRSKVLEGIVVAQEHPMEMVAIEEVSAPTPVKKKRGRPSMKQKAHQIEEGEKADGNEEELYKLRILEDAIKEDDLLRGKTPVRKRSQSLVEKGYSKRMKVETEEGNEGREKDSAAEGGYRGDSTTMEDEGLLVDEGKKEENITRGGKKGTGRKSSKRMPGSQEASLGFKKRSNFREGLLQDEPHKTVPGTKINAEVNESADNSKFNKLQQVTDTGDEMPTKKLQMSLSHSEEEKSFPQNVKPLGGPHQSFQSESVKSAEAMGSSDSENRKGEGEGEREGEEEDGKESREAEDAESDFVMWGDEEGVDQETGMQELAKALGEEQSSSPSKARQQNSGNDVMSDSVEGDTNDMIPVVPVVPLSEGRRKRKPNVLLKDMDTTIPTRRSRTVMRELAMMKDVGEGIEGGSASGSGGAGQRKTQVRVSGIGGGISDSGKRMVGGVEDISESPEKVLSVPKGVRLKVTMKRKKEDTDNSEEEKPNASEFVGAGRRRIDGELKSRGRGSLRKQTGNDGGDGTLKGHRSRVNRGERRTLGVNNVEEVEQLGEGALNRRVEVFWPDDNTWYPGTIVGVEPSSRRFVVLYDDNERESLDFGEEQVRLLAKQRSRTQRVR